MNADKRGLGLGDGGTDPSDPSDPSDQSHLSDSSDSGAHMHENADKDALSRGALGSLRRYIVDAGLKPGDRLPPERELAEKLGVSRNTLREALRALRVIGVLARRPKHGSYLQSVDLSVMADVSRFMMVRSASDLNKLFAARRVLEVSMLPLVAQNAQPGHYEGMEEAIRSMEAEIDNGGVGTEQDMLFHQTLLSATDNHFLSQFGSLLQEYFRDPRTREVRDGQELRAGLGDHKNLVKLLRAGEVEKAQEVMERHLDNYVRRGVVKGRALGDG
ncbi:MAG: FadR/GntR family transcriptional regulator [Armatimonadota bacterium]|nr:FadR/GntR family transcriptional regulator [Armatimonadota bacterium]